MKINEYDLRQLNLMLEKINAYKSGKLQIHMLIDNLDGLLSVLTEIDEEWKGYFRGYWWDIEQIYAFALFEEKEFFSDNDKKIIINAIDNLTQMIEIKLNSNNV